MAEIQLQHGDLKSLEAQKRIVTTEMKTVLQAFDWSEPICFDIETKPYPAEEVLAMHAEFDAPEPFCRDSVKLGNLKDPKKIADKIAKAKEDHFKEWDIKKAKYEAELIEKAALNPMTCEILVFTYGDVHENRVLHYGDEKVMIETFWEAVATVAKKRHGFLFGWNIVGFDIDCIMKRSMRHGIRIPQNILSRDKWINDAVFKDLYKRWSALKPGGKLKDVCNFLKVRNKTEDDGTQFHFWWDNERERAIDYAFSDVDGPIDIAELMGLA